MHVLFFARQLFPAKKSIVLFTNPVGNAIMKLV